MDMNAEAHSHLPDLQEHYSKEKKLHILDRLAWSEQFEKFLAAKYAAAKRFGLEGAETLIPGMKALIDTSAELGVEAICMGMPHRGMVPWSAADQPSSPVVLVVIHDVKQT